MILTHLSLTSFRNYARLDTEVPSGTLLLVGSNAQGKTSLLESVYMLATLSSFHAENDRQLIHFGLASEPLAVARIVGRFRKGGREHTLELRIIREGNGLAAPRVRKEVLFDGLKGKLGEAVGQFNAVLFLPQMLEIVEGSPAHRRRYLDLALAQVLPDYTAVLSTYGKAVSQRNALLKQLAENGGDPAQLEYWDGEIAGLGARLIHARIRAIRELEAAAAPIHLDLTRSAEVLRFDYQPAYDPLPVPARQIALGIDDPKDRTGLSIEEIEAGFLAALGERRAEELARGATVIGPHRDDLRFLSNRIDLGAYGSRGQVRTAMLSLKLAEVTWMKGKTGHWPVLLLDEVLAELDEARREDLLGRVAGIEQTLATTTDLGLFAEGFVEKAVVWRVRGGQISR
ncbi:MAG TPA: DNA replication/repair protein RecF [Anaerolineales bacterium]|nr:DNA replication/repair protein RecF [Anaerolineales bacterium]